MARKQTPKVGTAKTPLEVSYEVVSLDQFSTDPGNVREHGERNMQTIEGSLRRFGAARSLVSDKNGVIRAGSGTLEAARAVGIENAIVVDVPPDTLLVARRSDWSDTQGTAYSLLDNKATDMSEFNFPKLATTLRALREDGEPIEDLGWADYELGPLLDAQWTPPAIASEPAGDDKQNGDGQDGLTIKLNAAEHVAFATAAQWCRELAEDESLTDGECVRRLCLAYVADQEEAAS